MVKLYLLGYKGYVALKKIPVEYHKIISGIIIGRDKNVLNDYADEIKLLAESINIVSVEQNKAESIKGNIHIAIGWRWLIKEKIESIIVFHDSILPKYRGFNPLVSALINGDKQIGVTALFGSPEYDKGDIILQKKIDISYPIKIKDAIEQIAFVYADLLSEVMGKIYLGAPLEAYSQNDEEASYSLWRDEDDYNIDWTMSAGQLIRFINAVGYPYQGAKTNLNGITLRVFDAKEVRDVFVVNRTPGKVLFKEKKSLVIVCGQGLISISEFFLEDNSIFDFSQKFRLRFQ